MSSTISQRLVRAMAFVLSIVIACFAVTLSSGEQAYATPSTEQPGITDGKASTVLTIQSATKPAKPTITSAARNSKTKLTLYWTKPAKAKGFQVYMKTNSGKYKLIKTTSSTKFAKSGLKVGNTYYFKVRAYTKVNGKKVYGAYSAAKKVKLNAYRNLGKGFLPDSYSGNPGYEEFSPCYGYEIAGVPYYNGFSMNASYKKGAYATWNLNGKYSKVGFSVGSSGDWDLKLYVRCDGRTVKTITVIGASTPKHYSISVKGADTLEFRCDRKTSLFGWGGIGFVNPKLYY